MGADSHIRLVVEISSFAYGSIRASVTEGCLSMACVGPGVATLIQPGELIVIQSRSLQCLALAVLALGLPSCAAMFNGPASVIRLETVPPGAHFTTNAGHVGTTPCRIVAPSSTTLLVQYEKAGYEPIEHEIETRMSSWLLGTLIMVGPLGWLVDVSAHSASTLPTRNKLELVRIVALEAE